MEMATVVGMLQSKKWADTVPDYGPSVVAERLCFVRGGPRVRRRSVSAPGLMSSSPSDSSHRQ